MAGEVATGKSPPRVGMTAGPEWLHPGWESLHGVFGFGIEAAVPAGRVCEGLFLRPGLRRCGLGSGLVEMKLTDPGRPVPGLTDGADNEKVVFPGFHPDFPVEAQGERKGHPQGLGGQKPPRSPAGASGQRDPPATPPSSPHPTVLPEHG